MPKVTDSFKYEPNGLYLTDINNINRITDYYIQLISFYQQQRKKWIEEEGSFDDKQVVKERYTNDITFISHIPPFSKNELIFSNRENGYFAYTDILKDFNPFKDELLPKVNSFLEYLTTIQNTIRDGFFFVKDKRAFYGSIEDNKLIVYLNEKEDLKVPLLYFCESYTFNEYAEENENKALGEVIVSFPFIDSITLLVYTKECKDKIEKYTPIITNCEFEPKKELKNPGMPLFKSILINGFDDNIKGLKINGIVISLTDETTIYKIPSKNVYKETILLKRNSNNTFDFTFTFPLQKEDLPVVNLKIELLVEDNWKVFDITVPYINNEYTSYLEKIEVDSQEIYVNVPTPYVVHLTKDLYNINRDTLYWTGRYDETVKEIYPIYDGLDKNGNYVYKVPEFTIDSLEGERPTDFIFSLETTLKPINNLPSYYWASGYNTNDILPVPENIIIVKPEILDKLSYKEFDTSKYKVKFTARGTLALVDVKIKYIRDDLKYFNESDFKLEKISDENQVLTYYLVLDKKVFLNPVNVNKTNLKITFVYDVKRKDNKMLKWPADIITADMELSYYKDRWEIREATILNKLVGTTGIQFKIFDKLLNQYTNKFSIDERLSLNGKMVFSDNTTSISKTLIWDMRNQIWQWDVNIKEYGDVTIQYIDTVAYSNKVTIKHDKPVHPLTVTQRPTTLYTNLYGRVRFDLKYNDIIKSIYINGALITTDVPLVLNEVNDNVCYLNAIYSSDKKTITGIGIDFMPLKTGKIEHVFNVTGVNDFDYTNWNAPVNMSVEVKEQKDKLKYQLIVESFQYQKNCIAYIKTFDNTLETAQVVANLISVKSGRIVGYPNFDPIENGDFKSTNFFIDQSLKDEKEFILRISIYEYDYVKKDDDYPNKQLIKTDLNYKVTI